VSPNHYPSNPAALVFLDIAVEGIFGSLEFVVSLGLCARQATVCEKAVGGSTSTNAIELANLRALCHAENPTEAAAGIESDKKTAISGAEVRWFSSWSSNLDGSETLVQIRVKVARAEPSDTAS